MGDVPHSPGDPVDPNISESKVAEWLAAGIVERAPDVPARKKTRNAPLSAESQEEVKDDKHNDNEHPGEAGGTADRVAA